MFSPKNPLLGISPAEQTSVVSLLRCALLRNTLLEAARASLDSLETEQMKQMDCQIMVPQLVGSGPQSGL